MGYRGNTHAYATALAALLVWTRSEASTKELADLSLEELGNIKVTSVSKQPERLQEAPASIYVISRDEIHRSGAATIPEALRLAPNLQVARLNSAAYAISARGMNGSNNSAPNKMLVMINGRSVYSPLFSGVFWDVQDLMLEDVERIEVISGPAGTLWGVNAVNAVVNIITRTAADTAGPLASVGGGNSDSDAAFRYGAPFQGGDVRGYVKLVNRQHTRTDSGDPVADAGHKAQVGFRYDAGGAESHVMVSGNAYDGIEGQPQPGVVSVSGVALDLGDVRFSGENVVARWERASDKGSLLSVQAYYDHTVRQVPPTFAEALGIFDLQLMHAPAPRGIHNLTWGVNYRRSRDSLENSQYIAFLPARLSQTWLSLFLQDRLALHDDVDLILGARVERNDYTGVELLPSARLSWRATPNTLFWAAASRAVRAPSRLDRDTRLPGVPPFQLDGGAQADSELADVYEVGYRSQLSSRLSWSATVFHAEYDRLRTLAIAPSGKNIIFASGMEGRANGIETWGKFQATKDWRLSFGWTALDETLRLKPGSIDVAAPGAAGNDPKETWQIRSGWDITPNIDFDVGVRHAARLVRNDVPAYTAVDARVGWRVRSDVEFSLTGRNLTGEHAEYGPLANRTNFGRELVFRATWNP